MIFRIFLLLRIAMKRVTTRDFYYLDRVIPGHCVRSCSEPSEEPANIGIALLPSL